jgi:hypothetical protein
MYAMRPDPMSELTLDDWRVDAAQQPVTAASPVSGAKMASEIIMWTERLLRPLRCAIASVSGTLPATRFTRYYALSRLNHSMKRAARKVSIACRVSYSEPEL